LWTVAFPSVSLFPLLDPRNHPHNDMNRKHRLVALAVILPFTLSAWAQSQEPPKSSSRIDTLIWSIPPLLSLVAIAAFIWFILIKRIRKIEDKAKAGQKQHPGNDRKTP
jgi:hypothetical protein